MTPIEILRQLEGMDPTIPQLHPTDRFAPSLHYQIFSTNLQIIPFKEYIMCVLYHDVDRSLTF